MTDDLPPASPMVPDEVELPRIAERGHREFVGGLWDVIGRLQFDMLVEQGLRPEHVLLDIACGSLRGGHHAIAYLDRGNYLGIDRHAPLIEAGLREEVGDDLAREKAPELVVSADFEFERFSRAPDFAIAQSLFTHLTEVDIRRCLVKLRAVVPPHHRFLATIHEVDEPGRHREESGSNVRHDYTRDEMIAFGAATGWDVEYLGEWNHPRDQRLLRFTPAA